MRVLGSFVTQWFEEAAVLVRLVVQQVGGHSEMSGDSANADRYESPSRRRRRDFSSRDASYEVDTPNELSMGLQAVNSSIAVDSLLEVNSSPIPNGTKKMGRF